MVNIVIKDLDMSKELDKKAMKELAGGRKTGNGLQTSAWKTKTSVWSTSAKHKNWPG